jgi:TRAP-type C4-dicarboxylate transport system substrate-binding protein
MKRTVAILLTLVLLCGMLSACGGGSSSSAAAPGSAPASSAAQASSEAASSESGGSDESGESGIVDVSGISQADASAQAAQAQYGNDAIVVKFGNAGALGETGPTACQYFCDLSNIAFGGKYRFDFYPSEQLGNEQTMLENMQMGLQEVMMTTLSTMAIHAPDLNILDMAFCFTSSAQAKNYVEKNQQIWDDLESAGFSFVAYGLERNPRMLFCTWPLETAADMKGMKYRIPNLPIFEANARAMGATPTVTAYSEYAFALMQGVVDGGDAAKDAYYSAGFYESAPYASEVDFAYPFESIFFAKSFWDTLPAEDQEVFMQIGAQVEEYYNATIKDAWADMKQKLETEGGVTFVDCDRQSFIDATANLGYEMQESDLFKTEGLYDKVLEWNAEFDAANPS